MRGEGTQTNDDLSIKKTIKTKNEKYIFATDGRHDCHEYNRTGKLMRLD